MHVSTRFIDLCRNLGADSLDALAYVLAHEIGHKENNHFFAKEFGSAYASTEWGQQIRSAYDTIKHIGYYETQADEFGLFLSYNAGYNTFNVAQKVIDGVYSEYGLPDELPGYPSKDFRKEQAVIARNKVEKLIPVFEVGTYLSMLAAPYLSEDKMTIMESSANCFDHIIDQKIKTIEIYNNLGVTMLNMAIEISPERIRYGLPIELDFQSRLHIAGSKGTGMGPGGGNSEEKQFKLFEEYIYYAIDYFDQCLKMDRNYTKAQINLASANFLLNEYEESFAKARKALRTAKASNDEITERNAYDLLVLVHDALGEEEESMEYLSKARSLGSLLSLENEYYLKNKNAPSAGLGGISPDKVEGYRAYIDSIDIHNYFLDFDYEELVMGQELYYDIVYPYVKEGKELETWYVGADDSQIGKVQMEDGELLIYVDMYRRKPEGTYAFYTVNSNSTAETSQGLKINDSTEQIRKSYGTPVKVVSGNGYDYWVYFKSNIIFKVKENKIMDWIIYQMPL